MSTDPMDSPVPELAAPAEVLQFDYPGSDIVICSHDSYHFRALKLYIVNISPVLRDIIRNVSSTSNVAHTEDSDPPPVVELPENGKILYSLLTFIFPVLPVLPSTSEQIMELLAAAQKYQMDSVLSHVRGIIGARKDPPFIRPETAFHIYFLAQKHKLLPEALQAARVTLRPPMFIQDLGDELNSPYITGTYIHELWKYHEQVRANLASNFLEFRNTGLPEDVKALCCQVPTDLMQPSVTHFPLWLDTYIKSIADDPRLFHLISFENAWARHLQEKAHPSAQCSCVGMSTQVIHSFWDALTAVVHSTLERTDSTLALVDDEPTFGNSIPPSVPLCLNIHDANVILRSSDQVKFPVHRSVLETISPFFEDMFSLPQPTHYELVDGLPVVQLSEDASLLSNLVSLLYRPQRPTKPGSYEEVLALLAACQKYDMVSIQEEIRDKVDFEKLPGIDRDRAFSAYAIANRMGLSAEMEEAAGITLGQPMTFESLGEQLRSFNGKALSELVRCRAEKIRIREWRSAVSLQYR